MEALINSQTSVIIFKTNIETEQDLNRVAVFLSTEPHITKWSVDREDIDHVLRVEAEGLDQLIVKKSVEYAGFLCEDLAD